MSHRRITRSAALGLALAALAAPTATAQQQDLRSPDARDAAPAAQTPRDLRSPDTRDAALGRGTASAPQVVVIKVPQPAPSADQFDWGHAGIGGGAVFGLTLLGLGTAFAITHRRHGGAAPRRTAATG